MSQTLSENASGAAQAPEKETNVDLGEGGGAGDAVAARKGRPPGALDSAPRKKKKKSHHKKKPAAPSGGKEAPAAAPPPSAARQENPLSAAERAELDPGGAATPPPAGDTPVVGALAAPAPDAAAAEAEKLNAAIAKMLEPVALDLTFRVVNNVRQKRGLPVIYTHSEPDESGRCRVLPNAADRAADTVSFGMATLDRFYPGWKADPYWIKAALFAAGMMTMCTAEQPPGLEVGPLAATPKKAEAPPVTPAAATPAAAAAPAVG